MQARQLSFKRIENDSELFQALADEDDVIYWEDTDSDVSVEPLDESQPLEDIRVLATSGYLYRRLSNTPTSLRDQLEDHFDTRGEQTS